jgi:hypothetical protein
MVTSDVNATTLITQAAEYALALRREPVPLLAFDTCPRCHLTLYHNTATQQLVCPNVDCGHWKRFADMTSTALPYGEEVEFQKYVYRPVSHLDDTIRNAEGAESYVVPPAHLELIIHSLIAREVRPADLSISLVRQICSRKEIPIKLDNIVQIWSRLSGMTPPRMTPAMRDQMRIMFHAHEPPYRRHCGNRINHLSFPYTLYKFCEMLGYFEMLESFTLLRGQSNRVTHDSIFMKVCADLQWPFIPTVGNV